MPIGVCRGTKYGAIPYPSPVGPGTVIKPTPGPVPGPYKPPVAQPLYGLPISRIPPGWTNMCPPNIRTPPKIPGYIWIFNPATGRMKIIRGYSTALR